MYWTMAMEKERIERQSIYKMITQQNDVYNSFCAFNFTLGSYISVVKINIYYDLYSIEIMSYHLKQVRKCLVNSENYTNSAVKGNVKKSQIIES